MNNNNETVCIVPSNVFNAASQLCSENIFANSFNLHSLSMVIESIVLYDKIIIYDYLPQRASYYIEYDYLENELYSPIGYRLCWRNIITAINPYRYFFEKKEEYELSNSLWTLENRKELDISETGSLGGGPFLFKPPAFLNIKNRNNINKIEISNIKDGFSMAFGENMFDIASKKENEAFLKLFLQERIWQVEMGRIIRENELADTLFIPPDCAPNWISEKEFLLSALQKKYSEFNKTIYSRFLNETKIDFSPLTIVALDASQKRDYIIENILQMREDYKELRVIGRKYQSQLDNTKTYKDIEEVVNSWEKSWKIVLEKIAKTDKPLIRKLFGWDILKSVSLEKIAANLVLEVGNEINNNVITKKLSILYSLEKEFIGSRKVNSRIKALFKDIDNKGPIRWIKK